MQHSARRAGWEAARRLDGPALGPHRRAMDEAMQERATARLDAALAERPATDPRGGYRAALRALKDGHPEAFQAALQYYENVLVPRVAGEEADPLREWLAYGRRIAQLSGAGAFWAIAADGRAERVDAEPADGGAEAAAGPSSAEGAGASPDRLLLFVPERGEARAFVLSGPARPSDPQQASIDLLVLGRLGR